MRTYSLFACFTLVAAGGCAPSHGASEDIAGVRSAIEALRTAINAGDSAAFFALLADDIEVFPPGAEPARGAAARELFHGLFAPNAASLEPFAREELQVSGNLAVQRYSFRLTIRPAGGAPSTEAGSGLHVWQRGADDHWRLLKDIWTSPPVAPVTSTAK
jgi:ketosteroid isomerase-like protein